MALDANPPTPDFGDGALTHWVARARPAAHRFERRQSRQRMSDRTRGPRTLRSLQHALHLLGSALTGEPALNGTLLRAHGPGAAPDTLEYQGRLREGSGGGVRTPDPAVNSRLLYH